ncbi:MAG: hypothetical protein ACI8XU_000315 [Kiritimatiellia bacterium]|jgi:hypothetical protein
MFCLLDKEFLKTKRAIVIVALNLIYCLQSNVTAAEISTTELEPEINLWQWLLGPREVVSRNVTALGRNLDDWLAGEGIGNQPNQTYLSVRLNQQLGSLDGYHSRARIGGSLDLPRVSERWKLIFESDAEELNSLEGEVLGDEVSGEAIGGFSYQQKLGGSWQLDHTVGLRDRLPADPFYRFKARHQRTLNSDWSLSYQQKIWHYKTQGWGYDTDISFNRKISASKILQISSEIKYQQDRKSTDFSQILALHDTRAEYETLSYELGVLGSNKPNSRINDYFMGARYRQAIEGDWLFVELVPQLLVSRVENWRPEIRLILNLEIQFFDF